MYFFVHFTFHFWHRIALEGTPFRLDGRPSHLCPTSAQYPSNLCGIEKDEKDEEKESKKAKKKDTEGERKEERKKAR